MTDDRARADADKGDAAGTGRGPPAAAAVWDLPVRAFHWLLVALVAVNVVTGKIGGNLQMEIHVVSGYAILTLLLFRVAWGFLGGRHARFRAFVRGPIAVGRYVRDLIAGRGSVFLGHNPLGGWSVLAMLAVLLVQVGTGLCANDDILVEGPYARKVGKEMSDFLTYVHYMSSNVLLALIALHVAAVLFYLAKGDNLIVPMLTGRKCVASVIGASPSDTRAEDRRWLAVVLLAAAAGATWALVAV